MSAASNLSLASAPTLRKCDTKLLEYLPFNVYTDIVMSRTREITKPQFKPLFIGFQLIYFVSALC